MIKKKLLCAAIIAAVLSGCGSFNETGNDYMTTNDPYSVLQGTANGQAVTEGTVAADNVLVGDAAYDASAAGQDSVILEDYNDNDEVFADVEHGTEISDDEILPEAGLLTAGVWSDNDNWGFFSNLIRSERLSYPLYGLDPTKRIAVNVKTKDDSPSKNTEVELVNDKNELIWKGVTDYQGRVYLINQSGGEKVFVRTGEKGEKTAVDLSNASGEKSDQQAGIVYSTEMEIVVDGESKDYKNADIMFIIDSTGSMYDEMSFLKSEFIEITDRIGDENTRYSVNFYRDEGDEYLTKCSGFSSNISEVQTKLDDEQAAGGKGQIAAVAQALDETMNASDWSEDSVKLAFLIFDAPPYKEAAESLSNSIKTAASKGIRLIPVIGSGSDSDVENFGRAIAIETGGTYVFLTDDSGIGGSHEEPIIGEYEVRPLIEIITDIINEYRQ